MRPLSLDNVRSIHDLYPANEIESFEVFEKLIAKVIYIKVFPVFPKLFEPRHTKSKSKISRHTKQFLHTRWKRKILSLEKEILTVWKRKILTVWKGKF
jgi:hypothetical protein